MILLMTLGQYKRNELPICYSSSCTFNGNNIFAMMLLLMALVLKACFYVLVNNYSNQFAQQKRQLPRNWIVPEQSELRDFFLLSEVLHLRNSCKAVFNASVGEIFLPITWRALGDSDKEKMFVSRRITNVEDSNLVEDFTCIGCQLCGSPLDSENGQRRLKLLQSLLPKFSSYGN